MSVQQQPSLRSTSTAFQETFQKLLSQLAAENINETVLAADSSPELWTTTSPTVSRTRFELLQHLSDLAFLIGGPYHYCWTIFGKTFEHSALLVALESNLLSAIPADDSSVSADSIKALANVSSDKERLMRVLRSLVTTNLLGEHSEECFGVTALGKAIKEDESLSAFINTTLGEITETCRKLPQFLQEHPDPAKAVETGASPFVTRYSTDLWTYMKGHPLRAAKFGKGMQGMTTSNTGSSNTLLHTYLTAHPTEPPRTLILDIGGGSGHTSHDLALSFPDLVFQVQDSNPRMFPPTSPLPAQITYKQHDFFTPQPPQPPGTIKAMLVRHCCHNWHDPQVVLMIQGMVRTLESDPEAVILLNETILPGMVKGRSVLEVGRERLERQMDMLMLSLLGTRQRRFEEWEVVVKAADPRLEITGSWTEEMGPMGLLEIKLRK